MVHIENLSFGYSQKKLLFDDLQLVLPPGNIYGLLGRNGAGKSTLLKIMAGLLFPWQGKLDVVGFRPKDRYPQFLQEVYLVTEEFYLPPMGMKHFMDLYSPFYPRFNHGLFEEYLAEFKLPREQKLTALSYGQKKKFLLSFGLATDCKFLILDEPTNGLDVASKSQFRKIVANAIHEERSFIISTHQIRDMENLIDPIIILDEGKIVFFQDNEQISRKLAICKQTEIASDDSVIYYEASLGGYTVVRENNGIEETKINLEAVFNTVVNNKSRINEIFNS